MLNLLDIHRGDPHWMDYLALFLELKTAEQVRELMADQDEALLKVSDVDP